jgi:hypothetical protein
LLSITNYQITVQDEAIVRLKNNKQLAEEMIVFINSEFN